VIRVATDVSRLDIEPGSKGDVVVDVVNTGSVIDGISARVIGLPDQYVTAEPALLPLFPDSSGSVRLSLSVPATLQAGRHPLTVEVVSHGAKLPSQYVDLDLDVAARPGLTLAAQPRMIRARRGARFVLELRNEGNVALDVNLSAVDADRAVRCELAPTSLHLAAGAVAPVLLTIRGPRMFTGGDIDRTVTIGASARSLDRRERDTVEALERRETTVRLRQRPLISRGLLTALVLASIVALWAGVFLLGLTKVFSGDPMTKQAPASFFLANASGASGLVGNGGGPAPADALPKSGQLPPGTGGAITGTVVDANDHQPVGRILVQALRIGRTGLQLVSSAATQTDGTYTLANLYPTDYFIEFSADGFVPVWYPSATSQAGGHTVTAVAQGTTSDVNAVITGKPASISGKIDPGDTLTPVVATVTARALLGSNTNRPVATGTTAADGSYHLANLPAPGSYQLTFTAPGYRATTLVDSISGGDNRLEPTVTLGASQGEIAGTVTDGTNPIGGASVSTTVNGKPLVVATPTTGTVGAYILGGLPTPGTYVLTFTAPNHGSDTKIVDLAAGQNVAGVNVVLTSGTGSVTGRLVDTSGNGLGGATVTVGGAVVGGSGSPPSTVTLTTGAQVGTFAVNGLAVPGSYTLTFTLAGYEPTSVPVTLQDNGAPPQVSATMVPAAGRITGTVQGPSGVLSGAAVTATDGKKVWTTTSTDTGFVIAGLSPGHYSVTATYPGLQQQTALVVVTSNAPTATTLDLPRAGG
jgi:hypothetical protein